MRLVTLAPERAGAAQYIAAATARGVRASLGHCAPSPAQVRAAVDAGATLSTHLGNGTAGMLPRHPNHLWTQLAEDRLTAMLIADGHHLPAETLTVMIRAKGAERCVLTSDSAALAGMPPGRYRTPVGGDVEVAPDGRLSLAGTGYLAGSGSDLRTCLDWARDALPIEPAQLLDMASRIPASLLGLAERTTEGGDTVMLEEGRVVETRLAGALVHRG